VYDGTQNGPAVYSTKTNWSENGIKWNNRPGRTSGPYDDKGIVPANTWVEFDVTPLMNGDGTYSFVLAQPGSDGLYAYSREGSTSPELVVTIGTP
jgi:hypothetical protein